MSLGFPKTIDRMMILRSEESSIEISARRSLPNTMRVSAMCHTTAPEGGYKCKVTHESAMFSPVLIIKLIC